MIRIGIIGGGACGVMLTMQLIDRLAGGPEVQIHLMEQGDRLGAGVAYGTAEQVHILNMQAQTMSVHSDDPDHFVRWLAARRGTPATGTDLIDYVPRRLYGAYLRQCLEQKIATGTPTVTTHRCEVTGCTRVGRQWRLTAGIPLPDLDTVVLCLGDLPSGEYNRLAEHPAYAPTPWDGAFLDALPRDARVGILGTSLTAVDALAALDARGHTGPIACFSRRRGLPKVQPRILDTPDLKLVTRDTVERLALEEPGGISLSTMERLIRAELELALGGPAAWESIRRPDDADPLTALRADIHAAENNQVRWYEVLDAMSALTPIIWHRLSGSARQTMLAEFSTWSTYRHPMPLANAYRVERMLAAGILTVHTGISGIHPDHRGGFDVVRTGGRSAVDFLINATGTGYNPWVLPSELLHHLLLQGELVAHPLGGLDVDFGTLRVRRADSTLDDRMYLLGPLTRGVHFYTNSIETNRDNAQRLAADLVLRTGAR
ncbi:putative NAD(P)/FAD-binding protein YdhS [Allocatelliglobosispora scoriae]|uniref:Putative NAD(P)/FAD-binding protein YdhS n=1 Tax=Allocatelliglobosispora scoriae TaxID=643052 RepID=A0A841C0W5_9ACTN|nr:FAD/NAD(P)-binding protein [Allocatelliglobosispora scoriae]MBB5873575.1 putative NAD(P)/FAD-binding protein YdhS [Allocatelliglobosispora scoriae]